MPNQVSTTVYRDWTFDRLMMRYRSLERRHSMARRIPPHQDDEVLAQLSAVELEIINRDGRPQWSKAR